MHHDELEEIERKLERVMAQIDDLNAAVAKLQASVDALGQIPAPADLTGPTAAINAAGDQVQAFVDSHQAAPTP